MELSIEGPAQLVAFGSANPLAVGGYQSNAARSWRGRMLAILRGTGQPGRVGPVARSDGLRSGTISIYLS